MSTPEVTPDMLRLVVAAWEGGTASDGYARSLMLAWAARMERESKPLPTLPGWYPGIVVERGGESCTGALRSDDVFWYTARVVGGRRCHLSCDETVTIRWAEQDGTTPGQTLWELENAGAPWHGLGVKVHDRWERIANAVLAAHGTPTLTPVGEHPKPGTRGLLPVVLDDDEWGSGELGMFLCLAGSTASRAILVDPRPDGAHE